MNALVDAPDDGDVLSIGRRYRSARDRLDTLDARWIGMADDAPGKWETAEAAQAVLQDSERLLLAVFHRRTETVGDIAVLASHAFTVLHREVLEQEAPSAAATSALRALADISATAAKLAGLGFDMIGPPGLGVRVRANLEG